MDAAYTTRGFLPARDPVTAFASGSRLSALDEIGRDSPSLLEDANFRAYARKLKIPEWPDNRPREETLLRYPASRHEQAVRR